MYTFKHCYHQHILILCLLWLGLSFEACAFEITSTIPKSALIISNSPYSEIQEERQYQLYEIREVRHQCRDAFDVAKVLKEKGFEVILATNLNLSEMNDVIHRFRNLLSKKGGIGLFYFSGVAVGFEAQNYLLPNNFEYGNIEYDAVPLGKILKKMQKTDSDLNIVILDALPFLDTFGYGSFFHNRSRGLVQIEVPPPGTIIGYATASTTFRPGLYTKHLIKEIKKGNRINDTFMRINNAVKKESHNKQIPWYIESLKTVRCFDGKCNKKPHLTTKKLHFHSRWDTVRKFDKNTYGIIKFYINSDGVDKNPCLMRAHWDLPERLPAILPDDLYDNHNRLSSVPLLEIKQFQFEGNTFFHDVQLQSIMNPYYNLGISAEKLQEARDKITAFYVENGLINSGAYIPDQTVTDGIVTIILVEEPIE